ncbi:hypothetical protein Pcinc_020764 [Petrolisthes cinctipes]|uniref:Angio-associated migratory cell protein n=1 Tax=Petrolisthes cinctipes TaxID=88211 RepID=A0AAE1KJC4_PETCI|nr:hypothetical protein Pcinc_020764 [Petrolisthes cinctipes]
MRLLSSGAEHWSCKPGVESSILSGGRPYFFGLCVPTVIQRVSCHVGHSILVQVQLYAVETKMKDNTPPVSPGPAGVDEEHEFNIDDIGEVIELEDFDIDAESPGLSGADDDVDDDMDEEEEEEEAEAAAAVEDMASLVFTNHKKSVFTCCVSPDGSLAASGGEDDMAYIWDVNSGNVLHSCSGHKDSIVQVCFSHDGSLLATGDLAGYIQVWKVATHTKIWEFEVEELSWMLWHHASHVLLAGTGKGEMWMWLVPHGNTRTFPSYGSSSTCGAFMRDGKRAVSGYEDGSVRVFDLKSGQSVQQWIPEEAKSVPVVSLDTHKDNNLIITGSYDGSARLLNVNNGKVVGNLNCVVELDNDEEPERPVNHIVEGVSFCPFLPNIAVTSTLAGYITFWDISSQVSRHVLAHDCGSSQLKWHPNEPLLYSSGLDGTVRSYDVRSGEPLAEYTGHTQNVLALDISRNASVLVTASDDATVRVFKLS